MKARRSTWFVARGVVLSGWVALWAVVDAKADSVGVAVGGTSAQATEASPVATQGTATLSGNFTLHRALSLDLSVTGARTGAVDPVGGALWGSSGGNVLQAGGGLAWDPNDHLTLAVSAGFSPTARSSVGTRIAVGSGTADAVIGISSRSQDYGFSAGYRTGGDSPLEHSVSLGVSLSSPSVEQSIEKLSTTGIAGGKDSLGKQCRQSHSAACRSVTTALDPTPRTLTVHDSTATFSYTATIAGSTDLGIELAHHFYAGDDPNAIGYFGQVTLGRVKRTTPGLARGKGAKATQTTSLALQGIIPLGPANSVLSLSAEHGFGPLRLGVVGGYENYLDDTSFSKSLGVVASYDVTGGWNLSLGVSVARGVDEGGANVPSKSASIAVRRSY